MNTDQRLAEMYGQLAIAYMARLDADNASILAARAARFAGAYSLTREWTQQRGANRLLYAILKGWPR